MAEKRAGCTRFFVIALATIVATGAGHAQSLGDLAKRGQEDRAKSDQAPGKVYTLIGDGTSTTPTKLSDEPEVLSPADKEAKAGIADGCSIRGTPGATCEKEQWDALKRIQAR